MNLIEEYVDDLECDERLKIITSYEKYASDGMIGDEAIRTHARAFMEKTGIHTVEHITIWMEHLAATCFRHEYYAMRGLKPPSY